MGKVSTSIKDRGPFGLGIQNTLRRGRKKRVYKP